MGLNRYVDKDNESLRLWIPMNDVLRLVAHPRPEILYQLLVLD